MSSKQGKNTKLDLKIFKEDLDLEIWKVESSQDKLLKEYFLETQAFNELNKTKKFVISGRKGTGKSALKSEFERMGKQQANVSITSLNFDDIFSSTFFDNLTYENKSYRDLIRFIMNIRLLILISDEVNIDENIRDVVIEFLSYNGFRLDDFSQLYGKLQDNNEILLDKVSFDLFGFLQGEKSFNSKKEEYKSINYAQLIPDLEKFILYHLNQTGREYYILIDKLDEYWSSYGDLYNRIIVDFLTVVKDLNYKIREFNFSGNSKIMTFIRTDMIDVIRGLDGNLNKILQDELIKIDWQYDKDLEFESSLCKMIEKRLAYGLKEKFENIYFNRPYIKNALMNTSILKKDQYLWGQEELPILNINKGLFNRTFLRPRDFVKFFHFLSNSISWEHFMTNYSEYLLSELQDELTPILMKIGKVDIAIKSLSKTVSNNRARFKTNEYVLNYLSIYKLEYGDINNEQKIKNFAKQTLSKFYDYSVIGNIIADKYGEEKDFYRFNYRESNGISFDDNQECILHSGLYKALGVI